MAENAKDTKKQAALREQIEHHPIWNYPPEERLQHNREWQQLYLLVFQFKEFLSKIENRLENTDTNAMLQDEDALLDARYTRRQPFSLVCMEKKRAKLSSYRLISAASASR